MRVIVLLCLFLWPGFALAEEPTITVTVGDQTRIFTRDQLLARSDAATIQVPRNITYRVPMTYRAVPVASLLEGMTLPPNSIRSEQWPFQIAKLVSQPSPAARWPALAVDPGLPPTDPIRAGQALFVVQCLTCHKLNGAGAADVGPDLNLPQNPTEYLTPQGLHDLIRNPKAVRTWPAQAMPPFPPDYLSDREIGLVIAPISSTWPAGSSPSSRLYFLSGSASGKASGASVRILDMVQRGFSVFVMSSMHSTPVLEHEIEQHVARAIEVPECRAHFGLRRSLRHGRDLEVGELPVLPVDEHIPIDPAHHALRCFLVVLVDEGLKPLAVDMRQHSLVRLVGLVDRGD